MNQNRRTFELVLRALAAAVLLFAASDLWAQQTTGKIEGIVRDPTGQPIAGAQVVILGTSFSAVTAESGYYFIINVPSGVYSLRAQYIGYQPAEVQGARVLSGQTLTVNFGLTGAVALEAIVISVAEQPIVPRDQVSSKSTLTGRDLEGLPTEDALNVVQLLPGVVQTRNNGITIRGGRQNEAVIFVDGAPVRRLDLGTTPLGVPTNALEEISVTTGAMDAAFGDAQAGVISLVTKSGGPRYTGTLSYETDEPFGNSVSVGWNRFEGSVSGPILGNLTMSFSGTLTGQKSNFLGKGTEDVPVFVRGGVDTVVTQLAPNSTTDFQTVTIPEFVQFSGQCNPSDNLGFECQGRRQPFDWTTDLRLNGKLQLTYGSGSRISLSGLTNHNQGMNPFDLFGNDISLNSDVAYGFRAVSNVAVVNWVQEVFRKAESQLAFDVNLSYQTDKFLAGPLDRGQGLDLRDPTGGIVISPLNFIIDQDHYSDDTGDGAVGQLRTSADWDQLVKNMRSNNGTRLPFLNRTELAQTIFPRMNAYGITSNVPLGSQFTNNGLASVNQASSNINNERRFTFRANVDWQADRFNRFKFGGEGLVGRLNRAVVNWTGFDFDQVYTGEPVKFAAYAQDRVDLGDVVIELGVRWDRFDSRALFPQIPGRLFTNPAYDPAVAPELQVGPRGDSTSIYFEGEAHNTFSPRLRISFPVTDRTGFRLSYAHQVQSPDFNSLYQGTNNDLSFANTNTRFGGDVDFGKTILFEFGIRHAFSQDMVLDVAAYNKDKTSDITYRIVPFFDPFVGRVNNVNILTNADFGNVRGVDIQLLRRISNIFSGQISYTFQNSRSTGSDPQDYLTGLSRQPGGALGTRPEPPQATIRTRDDRRHNVQGTFSVSFPDDFLQGSTGGDILRNLGVFGAFQVRSGLPYTPTLNTGTGVLSSQGFFSNRLRGELQSAETPLEKFFDLRVTKGFRFGRADWTVYADIRNVFNFQNSPLLFAETGDIVNEEFLRTQYLDPQLNQLEQDAILSGAKTTTAAGLDAIALPADCGGWAGNGRTAACVLLKRVETRWGNGDGVYDIDEQTAAITAAYNQFNGPQTLFGQPRHIRVGAQVTF